MALPFAGFVKGLGGYKGNRVSGQSERIVNYGYYR
jgi:hypothetical protein